MLFKASPRAPQTLNSKLLESSPQSYIASSSKTLNKELLKPPTQSFSNPQVKAVSTSNPPPRALQSFPSKLVKPPYKVSQTLCSQLLPLPPKQALIRLIKPSIQSSSNLPQSSSNPFLKALLEVECMLRPLPRFFVNCVQVECCEVVIVDVRESLCWIVVDVNVLRRHLQLVTLNCIKIFPVRTLLVKLVHVIVKIQLVLGVWMQKLRRLLDLLLAGPVMCHVIDSLSTRSTRDHRIPLAIAASVVRR